MTLPSLTAPKPTFWQRVNDYAKHAVAVAASTAAALGILDPATHAIHVSGWHSLEAVGIATGLSLLLSYAGLGAPSAPKTVYVGVMPPAAAPTAVLGQAGAPAAPVAEPPAVLPPPIGP